MTRKQRPNHWQERDVRPKGPPDSATFYESYGDLVAYLCKPSENERGVQLPDGQRWVIPPGEALTQMQRVELLGILERFGLVPSN